MKWKIGIIWVILIGVTIVFFNANVARSQDPCSEALELCLDNCVGSLMEDACMSVCIQAHAVCAFGEPTIDPKNGYTPADVPPNCLCDEDRVWMCNARTGEQICVNYHIWFHPPPGIAFTKGPCDYNCQEPGP